MGRGSTPGKHMTISHITPLSQEQFVKSWLVTADHLQIIAFCFYSHFAQRPNCFGNGVVFEKPDETIIDGLVFIGCNYNKLSGLMLNGDQLNRLEPKSLTSVLETRSLKPMV